MQNFDIYLPIAEVSVSIISLLMLGVIGGILSGLFGVGGGFLITPLLIFLGIPPAVAVATSSNQIIAASVSGFFAHLRRKNVDVKMGIYLTIGGFIGSSLGVILFSYLKKIGQIDLAISLCYSGFLGTIGVIMLVESFKAIKTRKKGLPEKRYHQPKWLKSLNLPFVIHFERSDLKISLFIPVIIGAAAGVLVSLMGIGGGFIMIPAMLYLIGMPGNVVIGTSLLQIIFTTSNVTLLHAISTKTVDIVLAFILLIGAVIGAQLGTKLGSKISAERIRVLLAIMIITLAAKLGSDLFIQPDRLFTILESK